MEMESSLGGEGVRAPTRVELVGTEEDFTPKAAGNV
jgi:hypothetical protein